MVAIDQDAATVNGTVEETLEQKKTRFETLLSEGKRSYIVNDFTSASDKLSEACELSVSLFGQFGREVYEPHLYYGRTLLEQSRVEDVILSNALKSTGVSEEESSTEEEREEIAEIVGEAIEENTEALEKGKLLEEQKEESAAVEDKPNEEAEEKQDHEQEGLKKKEDMNNDEKEGEEKREANGEVSSEEKKKTDTDGKEKPQNEMNGDHKEGEDAKDSEEMTANGSSEVVEGDEGKMDAVDEKETEEDEGQKVEGGEEKVEEGDNKKTEGEKNGAGEEDANETADDDAEVEALQLAWETLDVARAVCDKYIAEDGWKEKKADVLLVLGDCSIQDENYKQAIDDLDQCLAILTAVCEPSDRRIAEAYFQKGRAYGLSKEFESAAKCYAATKKALELNCESLEKKLAGLEGEQKESVEKELKDLKPLITELDEKISDSEESAKNLAQIKEVAKNDEFAKLEHKEVTDIKPADDISSMVRKKAVKRAVDEVESKEEEESTKRAKCEEGNVAEVTD